MAPVADNHAARSAKLGLGALSIYGSGALVENITSVTVGALLLFYLNQVCGLSGSLAGAVLGATLVVDSAIDPIVGSISDNSRSRHGRRHPFMLAAIIPIVVAFGLLFSVPKGLSRLAAIRLRAGDAALAARRRSRSSTCPTWRSGPS